ncbi:MAG: DUF3037 domain-containing protein [Armatimonadota bacterium]
MSRVTYTYCALRYVHDPVVGEALNIGVLLYAREAGLLAARLDSRYSRLSEAFVGFDGDHYRRVVNQFYAAVGAIRDSLKDDLPIVDQPRDAAGVAALVWPDQGLSYRYGPVLAGVTDDLERTLTDLFVRLVTSQYTQEQPEKRSDDEVWSSVYRRPLAQALQRVQVGAVFREKIVQADSFSHKFDHAFKNEVWHMLQPLSFDLVRKDAIAKKAAQWLGYGHALDGATEPIKLHLLLGSPRKPEHQSAYEDAKELLSRIPIEVDLVEEEEADQFAETIAECLRQHEEQEEASTASS